MIGKISSLLFLSVLFLLFAQTNQVLADIEINGNITTDTLWSDTSQRYVVTGTLYIHATLTIEPGVKVYLNSNSRIYIGSSSCSTGKLVAQGTKEDPVIFTGNRNDPWYALRFQAYTGQGSILRHCIIENGGGSGYGMVYLDTANLRIEHCTFANSADYPIYVASAKSLSAINDTNTYTDNNDDRIYFAQASFSSDATMVKAGTPYLFSGSHYINDDVTLTIEPGVEVNLNANSQIYIGCCPCSTGKLVARGTEDDPVIFTGSSDAPWCSLRFHPYTAHGSILSHCIFKNGGGSGFGMVYLDTGNLAIEHCTFKNSASCPIYIASAKSLSAINDTSTYLNNNDNRIYFAEYSLSSDATMVKAGTPYLFSGSHYINDDVTLTIEPGVEVYLNPNSQIYIGSSPCSTGKLVARGTEEDPVIFTGSSDDPWCSLRFYPYTAQGSILSHCIIKNGGKSGFGMVYLDTGNLTIEHCTFKNSASCPIYLASANSLSTINDTSIYSDNNDNRIYVPETYLSSDTTRTMPVTESVPAASFTP